MEAFEKLCQRHSLQFDAIARARHAAAHTNKTIQTALSEANITLSEELSLIVFGSLARREWTTGSDVDWTLLVDGPVDPQHHRLVAEISQALETKGFSKPGATGTFGTMASSHDLVHHIGGADDTNRNMTRRLLMLLESSAAIGEMVRKRVIKVILERYLVFGKGIRPPQSPSPELRVPRFLLNDVVRLWRTIAVDYAAKTWQQADQKWALRNAKLRLTRKMTFVKGLLLCFDCEAFPNNEPWNLLKQNPSSIEKQSVAEFGQLVDLTPIDMLSRVLDLVNIEKQDIERLFKPYDMFLDLIDDIEQREALEHQPLERAAEVPFHTIRENMGKPFGDALEWLFFEVPTWSPLTRKYGLF